MDASIQKLQGIFSSAENLVFFGGAGVSTESGIPDFRSVDGLYHQQFAHPPEVILSHSFYVRHKRGFFDFYRQKMLALDAEPNAAHMKLAEMEKTGRLRAVITQNVDGLHTLAGAQNVLELHGSVHRNPCLACGKNHSAQFVKDFNGVPTCACGGEIKPDVVLYEESLDTDVLQAAVQAIRQADTLVVGGTSLAVYPAAGLLDYFNGRHLVVINKTPTAADENADLVLAAPIGQVFAQIVV